MTHLFRPFGRPARGSSRLVTPGAILPLERKTEKAEGAREPPAGRLHYARGWGTWGRCYRHNQPFSLCPTKTRCTICRVLSRGGWGLIHLSQWVSRGSSK